MHNINHLSNQRAKIDDIIDNHLVTKYGGHKLSKIELAKFTENISINNVANAWEIELTIINSPLNLYITTDSISPFTKPKLYVEKSYFGKYPHIDTKGKLCLLDDYTPYIHNHPIKLIDYLIEKAKELLVVSRKKENIDDFILEFQSYWNGYLTNPKTFLSLIHLTNKSKLILYKEIFQPNSKESFYLFADTTEDINNWTSNYTSNPDINNQNNTNKALYLWLEKGLYPDEYPNTGKKVIKLLKKNNCFELIQSLLNKENIPVIIILGFNTNNGICLGGLLIKQYKNIQINGFRKNHVPDCSLYKLFFDKDENNISLTEVIRVDPDWIYTRGGNLNSTSLLQKKVCIIGCGSLGADVAYILAKAGVGELHVIDYDTLQWSNIGRHLLGSNYINKNKALALNKYISTQMPHLIINSYEYSWQKKYEEDPSFFNDFDLIISTTANWVSDDSLNVISRKSVNFPPLIFGWYEPYSCAGHALAIMDSGGCLSCGSDEFGTFQRNVTDFGQDIDTLKREPACGTHYQPYGVVETLPVKKLLLDMAIDILLGKLNKSQLRTWIGSKKLLTDYGGIWNNDWLNTHQDPEDGNKYVEEDWHISKNCILCNKR